MPWSLTDAPKGTSALPLGAKRIFIAAANKVHADTSDDEQAMIAGWAAVKRHYTKGSDGKWTRKTAAADTNIANALIAVSARDVPHETLQASLEVLLREGHLAPVKDSRVEAAGGMGRNNGDAAGAGTGGKCVCPECGYTTTHDTGEPCNELKCAECGATMTRDEAVSTDAAAEDMIFAADHEHITDEKPHFLLSDVALGRNALARIALYAEVPSWWSGTLEDLQAGVRVAVYERFPDLKTKDIGAGPYSLLPPTVAEAEPGELTEVLADALEQTEDLLVVAGVAAAAPAFGTFLTAMEIETLQAAAEQKVYDLASVGREAIVMPFAASDETFIFEDDGEVLTFDAVVGQVETPLVPRMISADDVTPVVFRRESIESNFPRLEAEIAMGRLFGEADHPPDGKPRIRETCVVFDDIRLDGNDIVVHGRTTRNAAGRDVRDLALTPINLEFSLRGWGKPKPITWEGEGKFKGRKCTEASDFILRTFDVVTTGLATTGLMGVAADDDGGIQMDAKDAQDAAEGDDNVTAGQDFVEEQLEPGKDLPAAAAAPAPADDVEETVEETEDTEASAEPMIKLSDVEAAMETGIAKAMEKASARQEITAEIARVKGRVSDEPGIQMLLTSHLDSAQTVEEVREAEKALESVFPKLNDPSAGIMAGQGTIAGTPRDKPLADFMADGEGNVVRRPNTVPEVRELLMAGIEDTGTDDPGNDAYNFNILLDNYETGGGRNEHYRYLYTLTKPGYQQFEAASQTTALMGTQTPQVLPLLRYLYPKLFARVIASVQPMRQPTATVYWMRFQKMDGSTYTEQRSNFDYDWSDRETEATTKKQLGLSMEQANISAREKSIYYDIAQEVVQDMASVHGVNAQSELLKEAANEIAREVNYEMLYDMWDNSTGSALTFGTALPAAGWTNIDQWWKMLATFMNKASAQIRRDNYMGPNWTVVDPMSAALLGVLDTYETTTNVIEDEFGVGLKRIGSIAGQYAVYQADWFTENRILLGYKGSNWTRSGYVYAPYIPLYTSPIDYDAPTNTVAQSVTSRYGTYYQRPGLFGKITISSATGVNPF